MFGADDKYDYTDEHSDTGCGKCRPPTDVVPKPGSEEIAYKGADIDAHVKYVVTGVLQRLVPFFIVQVPEQYGDIGLEKTVAQNHHEKGSIESGQAIRNAQHQITNTHQ